MTTRLTIFHGDDIQASRQKLNELLEEYSAIERFSGKKSSIEQFFTAFASSDIFFEKKAIVIEEFFLLKKEDTAKFISYIEQVETSTHIIIWEAKKLALLSLKKFQKAQILEFSLPQYYFSFLDGLRPRNDTKIRDMLYKIVQNQDAEQLFYSIIKRMKHLLLVKEGKDNQFSETEKLSPWQKSKLLSQTRYWSLQELTVFYNKLFKIEKRLKTSSLALPLLSHIDILLFTKIKND